MSIEKWVEDALILRGVVGSTAHGLNLEGQDDKDEMGVCIEPLNKLLVLNEEYQQTIYRSAAERTGKHDVRSEAGDLDLTIFSLRKFCRLAAAGNPTVLLMFFTPQLSVCTEEGDQLRKMASLFVSKEAGKRFLGYMHGQRLRLLGEKGQKRVKRPELEAICGYDCKYAYHILRLGLQGKELLETGRLELPMAEVSRSGLLEVRRGEWPLPAVLTMAQSLEETIEKRLLDSTIPEHPDHPAIERWMQATYLRSWELDKSFKELMQYEVESEC